MKRIKRFISSLAVAMIVFGLVPNFEIEDAHAGGPPLIAFEVISVSGPATAVGIYFFGEGDLSAPTYTYTHDGTSASLAPPTVMQMQDISENMGFPSNSGKMYMVNFGEGNDLATGPNTPNGQTFSITGKAGCTEDCAGIEVLGFGQAQYIIGLSQSAGGLQWTGVPGESNLVMEQGGMPYDDPAIYGTYINGGTHRSHPYYVLDGGTYTIYTDDPEPETEVWILTDGLGDPDSPDSALLTGNSQNMSDPTGIWAVPQGGGDPPPPPAQPPAILPADTFAHVGENLKIGIGGTDCSGTGGCDLYVFKPTDQAVAATVSGITGEDLEEVLPAVGEMPAVNGYVLDTTAMDKGYYVAILKVNESDKYSAPLGIRFLNSVVVPYAFEAGGMDIDGNMEPDPVDRVYVQLDTATDISSDSFTLVTGSGDPTANSATDMLAGQQEQEHLWSIDFSSADDIGANSTAGVSDFTLNSSTLGNDIPIYTHEALQALINTGKALYAAGTSEYTGGPYVESIITSQDKIYLGDRSENIDCTTGSGCTYYVFEKASDLTDGLVANAAITTPSSTNTQAIDISGLELSDGDVIHAMIKHIDSGKFSEITNIAYNSLQPPQSPTLTVSAVASGDASENAGEATFTITAGPVIPSDLTIDFTFTGTAVEDTDYSTDEADHSVVIPAGAAPDTAVITVTGIDNELIDGNRLVDLKITEPLADNFQLIGEQATITILDDEDVPVPTITINPAPGPIQEYDDATPVNILVESSTPVNGDLEVSYDTSQGGTATDTDDYQTLSGTVTIPNGQTSANIAILPVDDTTDEGPETLIITITAEETYAIHATKNTTIATIADDDAPAIKVTPVTASAVEGEQLRADLAFSYLVPEEGVDYSVAYALTGSATTVADYTVVTGSPVTLNLANQSPQLIFNTISDGSMEDSEIITVTVAAGSGYTVPSDGTGTTNLTILDEGAPPIEVTIAVFKRAHENGTGGLFTVTSSEAAGEGGITVDYVVDIQNGTAEEGVDYESLSGSVLIPNGRTSSTIDITPISDEDIEGEETIILIVDDGDGYVAGNPNMAVMVMGDDDLADTIAIQWLLPDPDKNYNPAPAPNPLRTSSNIRSNYPVTVGINQQATNCTGNEYELKMTYKETGESVTSGAVVDPFFVFETPYELITGKPGAGTYTVVATCSSSKVESDPITANLLAPCLGQVCADITQNGPVYEGRLNSVLANNETQKIELGIVGDPAENPIMIDASTLLTTAEEWNGVLETSYTKGSQESLAEAFQDYISEGVQIDVESGLNGVITLSKPALITIRDMGFKDYTNLTVMATEEQGEASEVLECGEMFTGTMDQGGIVNLNNYNIPPGEVCYLDITQEADFILLATRHFSSFVVGEAAEEQGSSGVSIIGYGVPNYPWDPLDIMFDKAADVFTDGVMVNSADQPLYVLKEEEVDVGSWRLFDETYGEESYQRAQYFPASGDLEFGAKYTVMIDMAYFATEFFEGQMFVEFDEGEGLVKSFSFTTSEPEEGEGDGYVTDGSVPPMAFLESPTEGQTVSKSIKTIIISFDRDMDATTFDGNIYLKKVVDGVATGAELGTVSETTGIVDKAYLSLPDLEEHSEYQLVLTRGVKSKHQTPVSGQPVDGNYGWGMENMGPYKWNFYTGSAKQIQSIFSYSSISTGTGIATTEPIEVAFSRALNPTTIDSESVTLRNVNTSELVNGSVNYIPQNFAVRFTPDSGVLEANTDYTFSILPDVTSITGTAISGYLKSFTTDDPDETAPRLMGIDVDTLSLYMYFDEPLDEESATNKFNYTIRTCSGQANAGAKCADGETIPTSVPLLSGVNIQYDDDDEYSPSVVWLDGLGLSAGDGVQVLVNTNVKDLANNPIGDGTAMYSIVADASTADGGQGIAGMGNLGEGDLGYGEYATVRPADTMAGITGQYWIDIPVGSPITDGGWLELTFPSGFDIDSAERDSNSPINDHIVREGTLAFGEETTTFLANTFSNGADFQDGVVSSINKVYVKLEGTAPVGDLLSMDLTGIKNSSIARNPEDSEGYKVMTKIYDSEGIQLQAKQAEPFYLNASGSESLIGTVTDQDGNPLEEVTVIMEWPTKKRTTTDENGDYQFGGLTLNETYGIRTKRTETIDGTEYEGQEWPIDKTLEIGATRLDFTLHKVDSTQEACLNVYIESPTLGSISSLGANDSLDLFIGNNKNQFRVQTFTREEVADMDETPATICIGEGIANIGIGPALSDDSFTTEMPEYDWLSVENIDIAIEESDLGTTMGEHIVFTIEKPTNTIDGKVVDSQGNALKFIDVSADNVTKGTHAWTRTDSNGEFSLAVNTGTYRVQAFMYGMGGSRDSSARVTTEGVFIDGLRTASTGTSGDNQFIITMDKNTDMMVTGKVLTSDGEPLTNVSVNAHRTDGPGFVQNMTDSSGKFTLYMTEGVWEINADSWKYGFIGSRTVTVESTSLTGQNIYLSSDTRGTLSGTVTLPEGEDSSGIMVWVWRTDGQDGGGEAKTDANGAYSMNLEAGIYSLKAFAPWMGDLGKYDDVVVTADSTTTRNFTVGELNTVQISVDDELTSDIFVDFFNTTSDQRNGIMIPAGSSNANINMQSGTYGIDIFIPGVSQEDVTITGADYNSLHQTVVVNGQETINIDLPTLYMVAGFVKDASENPMTDVMVEIFNTTTEQPAMTLTQDESGTAGAYIFKVPAGSYIIRVPGMKADSLRKTVTGNSMGNNLVAEEYEYSIQGTVTDDSGNTISEAFVFAENAENDFTATMANFDGTYTLYTDDGEWTVNAVGPGHAEGTEQTASGGDTDVDFSLSEITMRSPKSEPITPSSGGTLSDEKVELIVPANALGSSSEVGTIRVADTNNLVSTPNANPIGRGSTITANASDGSQITNLNTAAQITFLITADELATEGVTTTAQAKNIQGAYWNSSTGSYEVLPTTRTFLDSEGASLPKRTLPTLLADAESEQDFATLKIAVTSTHFTTFAPILSTGDSPPATPAGLAAVAGDTTVALTWTANSEEDMSYYNIWEANVTEGVLTTLQHSSCSGGTCSKTITGLTNDTEYSFQILAVDSGANSSAGSSSVTATPVSAEEEEEEEEETPTPTPSSGSSVVLSPSGGSPSANRTEESISEFILETVADAVEVSELGTVEQTTTIISEENNVTVTFDEGTAIIDGADVSLDQGIPSPEVVEITAPALEGNEIVTDVYEIGLSDYQLVFSKPVKLQMALPDDVSNNDNFKIYYLNEEANEWVLAGDGGELKKVDGEYVVEVEVYHLTKFAIFKAITGEDEDTEEETAIFDDIVDHWAQTYIEQLYTQGIVSGQTEDMFAPDDNVTRAELAKIAINGFGIELEEAMTSPFSDVDTTDWFFQYVITAQENEVVSGYTDGTFKPNDAVNRAEGVKMLLIASDLVIKEETETPFEDIPEDAWFAKYVYTTYQLGVISGYDDTHFAPLEPITRAEATKIISKLKVFRNLRDMLMNWK